MKMDALLIVWFHITTVYIHDIISSSTDNDDNTKNDLYIYTYIVDVLNVFCEISLHVVAIYLTLLGSEKCRCAPPPAFSPVCLCVWSLNASNFVRLLEEEKVGTWEPSTFTICIYIYSIHM